MARRNFGDGALRLLGPSTSTGYGPTASINPSLILAAQAAASTGTGSFVVDVSLDGVTFKNIIAATTYSTAGITVAGASTSLFTQVRAAFTVSATTVDQSLFIAGR